MDPEYTITVNKMKVEFLQGRVLSGQAIQIIVSDLMTNLEEKNGLEFRFRDEIKNYANFESVECKLKALQSIKENLSLNAEALENLDDYVKVSDVDGTS
jgi:hypothetical protein